MTEYLEVDVRPILRTGGEPFHDHGSGRERTAGAGHPSLRAIQARAVVRCYGEQGLCAFGK
jgi:hypothetical protein